MLRKHFGATKCPSALNKYVVTIFPCNCVGVQQARSLRVGNQKWVKENKKWREDIRENYSAPGRPLRCQVCWGDRIVSALHNAALAAIKQCAHEHASLWLVCVEVPLERQKQNSARADVLLVTDTAQSWHNTVAIEINPNQHEQNPVRRGRSRAQAEQQADQYDAHKHDLCIAHGMQFLTLGQQSCTRDGAILEDWLSELRKAMRKACDAT